MEKTYGLMVFEEHILQIAVEFAGVNLGRADVLRRALNKENRAMIELARKLKWPVIYGADLSEVEVRLDLTTVKAPEILAAAGETVSVTGKR